MDQWLSVRHLIRLLGSRHHYERLFTDQDTPEGRGEVTGHTADPSRADSKACALSLGFPSAPQPGEHPRLSRISPSTDSVPAVCQHHPVIRSGTLPHGIHSLAEVAEFL